MWLLVVFFSLTQDKYDRASVRLSSCFIYLLTHHNLNPPQMKFLATPLSFGRMQRPLRRASVFWMRCADWQMGYMIVDDMHQNIPELTKDQYWDSTDFQLPYTEETLRYQKEAVQGSAADIEWAATTLIYTVTISVRPRIFVPSFPYFNGTGFVYFCIRKSTEWRSAGPRCKVVPLLRYSVDLRIQTYTEPGALKYGKLGTKYPWMCRYLLQRKTR